MIYKAIGLMSGSSLDGLDIAYVQFQETGGRWQYNILHADCIAYTPEWKLQLRTATSLGAAEYQLLHNAYGHYTGEQVNLFIDRHQLHHKVDLVASHGHTTFHIPAKKMTAQLGDGAAIAALTGLPVISDLRALDVAFGGHGAPLVTIGEKLLFSESEMLQLVNFKEALVIALMGVLRWREENNVLASATGAERNSIGGALWLGGEA